MEMKFKSIIKTNNLSVDGLEENQEATVQINWKMVLNLKEDGMVEAPDVQIENIYLKISTEVHCDNVHTLDGRTFTESWMDTEEEEITIDDSWNVTFHKDLMLESMHKCGLIIEDVQLNLETQTIIF